MVHALNPGEVVLWWMDLGSPPAAVIAKWRACLDAAEQAHADRFRFQEDRWTYIGAHWLVRTALASVGGLRPADWRFVVDQLGKPRIDPALGRPAFEFNLSHTRGFAACAVCLGTEIGIDVEALGRRRGSLDVAQRLFSSSEVSILRHTAQDQQADMFFRLWTLKEAFIKATGEGLSRALDSFSFSLDPVSIALGQGRADEETQWQFIEQRPTTQHLLALAVRRPAALPVSLTVRAIHPPACECHESASAI